MNKQFLLSVVVAFIVSTALGYAVHEVLLKADYAKFSNLMRPEADGVRHLPALLLAHAFFAVSATVIYRRGREAGKGWMGQGVCFGIWFAAATCVPFFLINYAVQPLPMILAVKQIIFGGIATVLLGIVVAGLNQQSA